MIRLALMISFLFVSAFAATAQERSSLLPEIPAATGEPHPEGNAFWREKHMDLMRHDRDKTLRDGDREIEASLAQCFDCHAAKDEEGNIVTYESEKHFCRTCHDYAAVKVDCFMCHRSTPEGVDEGDSHSSLVPMLPAGEEMDMIAHFLSGIQPLALPGSSALSEVTK